MHLQTSQSTTFRFRDDRQARNYKRLDLVGKGPAAFYKDAHRLISDEPLYESTVNIVSHLLREVESALRAVLLPYDFEQPEVCDVCGSKKEMHKRQIKAILTSLDFGRDDDVSKLWLKLADQGDDFGLARKAHRDALAPPRRVDSGFYTMLTEIDTMLDAVLTKFEERFLAAIPILDELLYETPSGKRAVTRLQNDVPNNGILHGYFFHRLNDSAWLVPLNAKEFFAHPPAPVHDTERGIVTYPSWPEARYLERMAALDLPEVKQTVLGIALKVETDNPTVYLDLTKAVLRMPPGMQTDWARKMTIWLGREIFVHPLLPKQLGNLASSLAEGGFKDAAVDLLRALLTPQPEPREGGSGVEANWGRQPRPRFNLWHYAKIIKRNIPVLAKTAGRDALTLLCDLLEEAIGFSRPINSEGEGVQDYWRPSIDSEQRSNSLLDPLVSGVRDVAAQIATDDSTQVFAVVEMLERRRGRIFKRLSLHLLSHFPDAAPKLVAERLTNKGYFEDYGLRREYNALLKICFSLLEEEDRTKILSLVEEGPQDIEGFKEGFESWYGRQITESDVDEYVTKWKLERLAPIRGAITGEWKDAYSRMEEKYGRQEPDEGLPYLARDVEEYVSPKSAEELGGMELDDIVAYLKSWQPSEGEKGHSILAMESALRETILKAPELFSRAAERFKDLRLEYIRALISGLTYALSQSHSIDWEPILELCMFVAAEPLPLPAEDDVPAGAVRILAQLKNDSASLIRMGMREDGSRIADALSDKVFELLQSLIDSLPQVGLDQLSDKRRSTAESVLSARAATLEGIITHALWVHNRRREADDSTAGRPGEDGSGAFLAILDRNLNSAVDPDLRLRKVYGEFFPTLVYLAPAWASCNVPIIFPTRDAGRQLFDAAWQPYLNYAMYFQPAFDLLQEQYGFALERLGSAAAIEVSGADPERQLAQHIMVSYGRGNLTLDDAESLINRFFTSANQSLRATALGFIGEDLRRTEGSIDAEILNRLQTLWSTRLDRARRAASTDDFKEELAAFGWWFVSEKFDEEWALQQLREVLLLVQNVDADDFVVERLAALATKYPAMTVECLGLMIDGDKEGYGVELWKNPAQELLKSALGQEGDESARREATVLINRISAKGAIDHALLLSVR
jgi:hypothetical protein